MSLGKKAPEFKVILYPEIAYHLNVKLSYLLCLYTFLLKKQTKMFKGNQLYVFHFENILYYDIGFYIFLTE